MEYSLLWHSAPQNARKFLHKYSFTWHIYAARRGSHPQFDFHFAQMLAFAAQTAYTCTGGQESPAPEYALYFEEKTAAGGN
jgi:hypothetical protein